MIRGWESGSQLAARPPDMLDVFHAQYPGLSDELFDYAAEPVHDDTPIDVYYLNELSAVCEDLLSQITVQPPPSRVPLPGRR